MLSGTDHLGLISFFVVPYISVLVVPGPNFLVVSSAALRSGTAAIWAALGVACGGALAATAAAASVIALPDMPGLPLFGTVVFCLLMLRSAVGLLRPAQPASAQEPTPAKAPSFLLGVGAAALNPLTIPFVMSLFLAQPMLQTSSMAAAIALSIFVMASLWFSAVGLIVARSAAAIEGQLGLRPVRLAMAVVIVALTVHAASGIVAS